MVTRNITHITDKAKYSDTTWTRLLDRDWFVGPMKDGKVHVSDFYTSRFTGALCITVSGPIRNGDEKIVGVMGADLRFEDLVKLEAQSRVEGGGSAANARA